MAYTVVFLMNFEYSIELKIMCVLGVQIVIVAFESCHTQLYFVQAILPLSHSLSLSLSHSGDNESLYTLATQIATFQT